MKNYLSISRLGIDDERFAAFEFTGSFDSVGFKHNFTLLQAVLEEHDSEYLVFDFGKLTFINSRAVGFLIEAMNFLQESNRKLVLVGADGLVKDVLQTTGVFELIAFYPSLDAFKVSITT
ncbi:hypothetical protein CVV38_03035 [Candidatus Peregrinibacteria bacterium HGW-Peregrinibacteria-1]|jgi:anti-anti-sigma factor|nr:MAG: hypothetical protein CVV38_03035 [Candidatus Peregrinibacteria bacterium HGW-Peregrinibacteria-1]